MLNVTADLRNSYNAIQRGLFYMIPEKWDKVYLYASVFDHYDDLQTGEMFFYYYPKSVIKKNPINVYEIPNKFNIDESSYLKLAENLYQEIKKLRAYQISNGDNAWTNITITVKDFKFTIEYNYDDLIKSSYSNYDRHLIWRYKYLDIPLSSYSKTDRQMVERYLSEERYHKKNSNIYNEPIYKIPDSDITQYNRKENKQDVEHSQDYKKEILGKFSKYVENLSLKNTQEEYEAIQEENVATNQILKIK